MRYLTSFGDVNVDEINDVEVFKQMFFAEGYEGKTAGFTVQFHIFFKLSFFLETCTFFSFAVSCAHGQDNLSVPTDESAGPEAAEPSKPGAMFGTAEVFAHAHTDRPSERTPLLARLQRNHSHLQDLASSHVAWSLCERESQSLFRL